MELTPVQMEKYQSRAKELVNFLMKNEFSSVLAGVEDIEQWEDDNCGAIAQTNWKVAYGATRAVFYTLDDLSVVYKIQYITNIDRVDTIEFNKNEQKIYEKAVAEGVKDYFTWIHKIYNFTYNMSGSEKSVDVYVAQMCDADFDTIDKMSYDYAVDYYNKYQPAYNINDFIDGTSSHDKMMIYLKYYTSYGSDLVAFIKQHRLNDLGAQNWGYANNHLVCLDYGGYPCR